MFKYKMQVLCKDMDQVVQQGSTTFVYLALTSLEDGGCTTLSPSRSGLSIA